ncbi:cyclase family protein [Pannonibacter sp. SL95]|uniref:cyclase family protein n=1 Tax=Pannonibacter sp. SL95 TaxID=2995153 RepID=UPI002276FD25|nr:cyclase family protein [Pannonibacter sp. SL95]MCY1704994.1 cyclase family protein [Pannonibacter sp. SL95]
MRQLSRRGLMRGVTAMAATAPLLATAARASQSLGDGFSHVIDLTHAIDPDFPTYWGGSGLDIEPVWSVDKDGFALNIWHLWEHTGTHLDAPLHYYADGLSLEAIPAMDLVTPLVVIDISQRADHNNDAEVLPKDILEWEVRNGPLPVGCCVVMRSGWETRIADPLRYRNVDAEGTMHFPGFGLEAARFLLEQRQVTGIGSDTLSLEYGPSRDFPVHLLWLGAGRWGLENLTKLAGLPEAGATLVVGAPKVAGATGGPSRVFALTN